ncbi:RNase adapter RapZ [Sedimentibacter sp. MB31-C6]|uniref:RNase adapter RapZ n=1 Tax=Sedimentibacter sp. MB31-C6 TaxID=3109366 RepID=UPI002DDDB73E|nr:RNase adapter RapZ [Sedimentibacter sp. MB36-C1]WSI03426.1 RNase adapter RapZ [Sedimentibacter sp. MB36-C1]
MEFVIITGMSGAGKSQAINVLEDINYYCMDNLPPALLPNFAELCKTSSKEVSKVAVVADIRGGIFFKDLFNSLEMLKNNGIKYHILFLDASDEDLVKRYKELRRPHPLSTTGRIIDGIQEEREMLKEVKQKSDYIIDTSSMKLGRLKEEILSIFVKGKISHNMNITIMSFGYKYGLPNDSDLVFDVRFLPNPYYIEKLKYSTGNDTNVQDYVMSFETSEIFIDKLISMLKFLMPLYIKEGKSNLVISIGCTGGKHRSVTISNKVADLLSEENYRVLLTHRDAGK